MTARKDTTLKLRLTSSEAAVWKSTAANAGISTSELVRRSMNYISSVLGPKAAE